MVQITAQIPARVSRPSLEIISSVFCPLNQVIHVWPYESMDDRIS